MNARPNDPRPSAVPGHSPNKPLFSTVTGSDFGRVIKWAKQAPNQLTAAISAAKERLLTPQPARPDPAQLSIELQNAHAADQREQAAADLALDTGVRNAESAGIAKHSGGSLAAQLTRAPAPSHPLTLARNGTAAIKPGHRITGF